MKKAPPFKEMGGAFAKLFQDETLVCMLNSICHAKLSVQIYHAEITDLLMLNIYLSWKTAYLLSIPGQNKFKFYIPLDKYVTTLLTQSCK